MNNLTSKNFWNPWADDVSNFQRAIERFFGEGMPPALKANAKASAFNPACDVEETGSHYIFSFEIPGVNKNDIKVEMMENQLIVSGERKYENVEKKQTNRLSERYYGSFQRVFSLPSVVDAERVEATYDNGVLRIAIPKSEATKNKTVKITEGKTGVFPGRDDKKDANPGQSRDAEKTKILSA